MLTEPDLKSGYEVDWTGRWRGEAAVVVLPRDRDEVTAVVRVCGEAGVSLVPQGGNTGLVGGGVPCAGQVVLSLRRMDRIWDVDPVDMSVVAEAGATLASLQGSARAAGLGFGVDFAARDTATVGGMLATNAGGIHFVRHGNMRRQTIAVEAVSADASTLGRVPGLPKDNTGYDISSLLVGSEGTLGVITRAHLQLVQADPERAAALLAFAATEEAIEAVSHLRRFRHLSAIEILDDTCLEIVASHRGIAPPFPRYHTTYLLIEAAGGVGCAEAFLDELSAVTGCADSAVASESPDIARLWQWREGVPGAISALGIPHKFDVTVPIRAIGRFEDELRCEVTDVAPSARIVLFGHAGDGNLHVNVLGLAPDDDRMEEAVFRLVHTHGGSISAEHGIGIAKRRWLSLTRSRANIEAMRRIKHALDPGGLLNPGVLLP